MLTDATASTQVPKVTRISQQNGCRVPHFRPMLPEVRMFVRASRPQTLLSQMRTAVEQLPIQSIFTLPGSYPLCSLQSCLSGLSVKQP